MDVLMVAAELSPYARASEAAEAVASLSKVIRQLGHDVTIALPRYPGFEERGLLVARRLTPLSLPDGRDVTLLDGQLASGVRLVLFDAPEMYERSGIYGEDDKPYADNAARFGLLSHAAAALVEQRSQQGQPFDVVHLHDWPAALVPIALSRGSAGRRSGEGSRAGRAGAAGDGEGSLGRSSGGLMPTVLTIHDLRRQGQFSAKDLPDLGIGRELYVDSGVKLANRVNVLKGGLLFADVVTTGSLRYVAELKDDERSGALARFVEERGVALVGIPGGVDYATCNPAVDPALVSRYNAEDPTNKHRSKTDLLRRLELDLDLDRPLVVACGELNRQNGFDVLAAVLPELLTQDATFVLAGQGAPSITRKLLANKRRYPETFGVLEELDDVVFRRLAAAADFLLVAPQSAPTAYSVLVGHRYGAVPIAHATGAIQEAIVDCDAGLRSGTGFLFDALEPDAMTAAVQRALTTYPSPGFAELRRRIMRQDLGWDRAARRTLQVYRQAINAKAV